jgi:hypothetical protein
MHLCWCTCHRDVLRYTCMRVVVPQGSRADYSCTDLGAPPRQIREETTLRMAQRAVNNRRLRTGAQLLSGQRIRAGVRPKASITAGMLAEKRGRHSHSPAAATEQMGLKLGRILVVLVQVPVARKSWWM